MSSAVDNSVANHGPNTPSNTNTGSVKTINMLIAALGGEGGGVLTNWLIEIADRSGWYCQSTSLAGVAQRTGATIYYLEFIPREEGKPYPVMSLFPAQGDIDVAVTSEIAEAGRMLSRGFVSPERTTLISSNHRVYGITEKSAAMDGTVDAEFIIELADRYAKHFVHFDIAELVKRHGTVISAGLLGAIAGAGVLPFSQDAFMQVIAEGKGAAANTSAFLESFERATRSDNTANASSESADSMSAPFRLPAPSSPAGRQLIPVIASFPGSLHEVLFHGAQRLVDYLDIAYAEEYLDSVRRVLARDDGSDGYALSRESARWLALWMAFEDIPRVAQLKLRPNREAAIREEVQVTGTQPLKVSEYFHPRVEEVVAILPEGLGNWIYTSPPLKKALGAILGPRTLRTDTVLVSIVLRVLAGMRKRRRGMLGYQHERKMIDGWFDTVVNTTDIEIAKALADCGRMVKGYGATRHRTSSRLIRIVDLVASERVQSAQDVWALQAAAMLTEDSQSFSALLESLTAN